MAQAQKARFSLSEDWLATIIGLVIVLVIGSGLIGPGPQSVALKAKAGETAAVEALAISGWKTGATVGSEKVTPENAPTALAGANVYAFTCSGGQIKEDAELAKTISAVPPAGKARLILNNQCDQDASITYTTAAAIKWPIFSLFAQ